MGNGRHWALWGVLTLMSLTREDAGVAAEPIYPFQQEVEKRLNGSAEENRKYAVLLPLRVAMMDVKVDYAYRRQVLEEIDRLSLVEALPLLEAGLAWKSTYWEGQAKDYAARLWIRFKTGKLHDDERLAFLVSTFRPGFPLEVQAETRKELAKAGKKGKEAVLTMLKSLEESFSSSEDLLIAVKISGMFNRDEALIAAPDELAGLMASSNPYVRYVCLRTLSMRGDRRAPELALGLLDLPNPLDLSLQTAVLDMIPYCPDGERVYVRVLKDLRNAPLNKRRELRLQAVLSSILGAQRGPFSAVSTELKSEVLSVARREDPGAPALAVADQLVVLGLLRSNKELAEQLVAKWDTKEGKQRRE